MLRRAACSLFVLVVVGFVAACQSSREQQPPQQQQQQQRPQQGCGIQIFQTPACQASLDQVCCPIELDCAKDPTCQRLAQCFLGCKSREGARAKDNCANGCGMQSRHDYCAGACQGQGSDCHTVCMQKGAPGEPMMKFGLVANCSKSVRYPENVTCNDST